VAKHKGKARPQRGDSSGGEAATRRQAMALLLRAEWAAAEKLYGEVLRRNPRDFDATHMLGVIALQTGRAGRGVTLISAAVRLNPSHAQALANLGSALLLVNRADEAITAYDRALKLDPRLLGALSNLGTCLQRLGRHDEAANAFQRLLEAAPASDCALGDLFYARRCGCDWREYSETADSILATVAAGRRVDRPFPFLSVAGAGAAQLQCARTQAAAHVRKAGPALWRGERYAHERIRVAYVSADFRSHAVLNQMNAIFERHDRNRFETIGVSLNSGDGSELLQCAQRSLAEFIDASSLSDLDAAKLLRSKEVDVAIDLTGYTQGARTGIFAWRPAPIQVNFLGFPGTMGAPFIDYIIADSFIAPPASRGFYDERLVLLPDSFQANAPRMTTDPQQPAPTRGECGLPAAGLVLCSFNNSYKLNPRMFECWARILQAVPDCVLWLLAENPAARDRLRAEAATRGIAAERVVFAARVPYGAHLARLQCCDLYLDTVPFNGGATASDVLRAGVPMLTCAGEAFASRMAGSLLRAAGLPELIAADLGEYERRAIDLAANPARLAELKTRLASPPAGQALFDSDRYCKHLESAYVQMWQRAERGEPAADITVDPQPS
jgi:predicted O-linked N-acetylglucosamine transferase (SPINDLY family)